MGNGFPPDTPGANVIVLAPRCIGPEKSREFPVKPVVEAAVVILAFAVSVTAPVKVAV